MKINSSFAVVARCLGILLTAGVLIFCTGCSAAHTTPSVASPADKKSTSSPTEIISPIITQTSPLPTQSAPLMTPEQIEKSAMLIEETVQPTTVTVETGMTLEKMEIPAKGNPKLDSPLNQLLEAYHRGGLTEAQDFAATHMITLVDDSVQVEIMVTEAAMIPPVKETIEASGGKYQGHYQALLQALLPISALESLAERPEVQVIRSPQPPLMQ